MQTKTRKAIAKMILETFTVTSKQEFLKVNISPTSITPEPAQEVKNLSFTSQARDAAEAGSYPVFRWIAFRSTNPVGRAWYHNIG